MSAFKGTDSTLSPSIPPLRHVNGRISTAAAARVFIWFGNAIETEGVRPEKWLPREEVEEDNENWENGDGTTRMGRMGMCQRRSRRVTQLHPHFERKT